MQRAGLPGKWQGQITHEDRRSLALAELYVPPKLLRSRPRHIASVVLEDQGVAARRDHEELADHRRRQGPWLRHSLAPEWNPLRPPAASLAESQRTLSAPAAAARSRSQNSAVRGRDELRGPMARRGQWLGGRIWEEAHPSRRRARPPRHPQATTPRLALWSVSALGSGLHIFVGKGCSPSSLCLSCKFARLGDGLLERAVWALYRWWSDRQRDTRCSGSSHPPQPVRQRPNPLPLQSGCGSTSGRLLSLASSKAPGSIAGRRGNDAAGQEADYR